MSASEDPKITFAQLQDIEDDFEDVELDMIRQQDKLTKALYEKREKLVSQIPNFWALVLEQSPPDIDEYIQPTDSAVLATALKSISVERFELPSGDPRSLLIKFEFDDNEFFTNKTIEKKFWWRHHKDGWEGLVSEPVKIQWKADKDLTGGMLDLAYQIWEDDKSGKQANDSEAKTKLKGIMENTGLGGVSFFAWFGFRGRNVSAQESQEAKKEAQEKRQAFKAGKDTDDAMDEDEDEDEDDDEYEWEIFPTGDDLAVSIAEDLYPSAIKYFMASEEDDMLSDVDFESDEDMDDDEAPELTEAGDQPTKKRKA